MVKGSTRQVIVVKSPDPKLFDEAIFIVREKAVDGSGVTAEVAMAEAQRAAVSYMKRGKLESPRRGLPPMVWTIFGGIAASAGWASWLFLL